MIPYGHNILVKPIEKKQILISDVPAFTDCGEVVAVGKSVKTIKKGDKIGYLFWGMQTIKSPKGEEFHLIPDTDEFILGLLEDED